MLLLHDFPPKMLVKYYGLIIQAAEGKTRIIKRKQIQLRLKIYFDPFIYQRRYLTIKLYKGKQHVACDEVYEEQKGKKTENGLGSKCANCIFLLEVMFW